MISTTHLSVLIAGAVLLTGMPVHAGATAEQQCLQGRYAASAKYLACQQRELAKYLGGGDSTKWVAAVGRCRIKYAAAWPKVKAKLDGTGTVCDGARFVDEGATVTDNLTGLEWEKKTDDGTIHDKDDVYQWSPDPFHLGATGSAFTTFLPALNSDGCFAGNCDWRLPTVYELQTIMLPELPCHPSPCIDPMFGPTAADYYWSSTSSAELPGSAWIVFFDGSNVNAGYDGKSDYRPVRAARGGL